MHRFLRGTHAVFGHAAVIACEQHRPLGEWNENGIVNLEFDRELDLPFGRVEARGIHIFFQLAQDGRGLVVVKARAFEVGRQRHHQHVGGLSRRTNGLGIGAVECHGLRVERIPDPCVGVGGLQRRVIKAGNALDIGQRRHVHDRHAGHARLRHRVEQLSHAWRTVLRLLHAQSDEVEFLRINAGCGTGRDFPGQLARFQHHRILATAHRHAHRETFRIDKIGLLGEADQMNGVTSKQKLGGKQRPVGRSHEKYVVGHADFLLVSLF